MPHEDLANAPIAPTMHRYFQYLVLACGSLRSAYAFSTWHLYRSNRYCIDVNSIVGSHRGSQRVQLSDRGGIKHCCHRGLTRFSATTSCTSSKYSTMATSRTTVWPPPDRLSEYVTESFLVDYGKLAAEERDWLAVVIGSIKETDPAKLEKADRHAFLINAYNLWTLHWVIRERRWPRWKGHVSTFAKARFFYWHKISTGQGKRNLFGFENKDIRPEVNDARVHFALNCASVSCPPLRRTLFTGANLDTELDEVTSAAVNGGNFVQLMENGDLLVNPIFKWYKDDFDEEGGILAFIRKHWKGEPLSEDPTIDFFEYDWRSNSSDATWADRPLGGPAP